MTDTSKREELIEQIMDELHPHGLWNIHQEEHHLGTRAKAERLLTVFEQAHTPTDDEREALGAVAKSAYSAHREASPGRTWADEAAGQTGAWEAAATAVAVALRRTAVQEPTDAFAAIERAKAYLTDASETSEMRNRNAYGALKDITAELQGEPTPVRFVARQSAKSQTTIDALLAQANEHGIRVEVVYPQGEPTDTELLAASNAYMHYKPPYDDLSAFSLAFLDDMRAALRAAYEEGKK